MALTKISRGLLNTGVSDNSDATAITISSTEDVTLANHLVIADDKELRLGNSSDVTFKHHNSGYGHLQNTGLLYIDAETISLRTDNSSIGERVHINSAGSVGIGMTPFTGQTGYSLQLGGTSQTFISIHNNTTGNTVNDGFSLGNDASNVYLTNRENTPMIFSTNNAERMKIDASGHITPGADGTQDLGTNSKRWRNVFSADLQLSNVDTGGNDVDGSEGSWTIQEGENDLFIINRKNGKKYKFSLEEIE